MKNNPNYVDVKAADSWCYTTVSSAKVSTVWTIHDFSNLIMNVGKALNSAAFSANGYPGVQWQLEVYPNGRTVQAKDKCGIFLVLVSSDRPYIYTRAEKFAPGWMGGFDDFLREYPLPLQAKYTIAGHLKLYCEVTMFFSSTMASGKKQTDELKTVSCTLTDDFNHMYETRKFADFTFVASGQEFPVHKSVLSARSPVFAAMFEHDMKENAQNRVVIPDVSPDVLEEMLRYIYSGKSPDLARVADGLLVAADKYALDRLKQLCTEYLIRNLSVGSVAKVYVLADLHNNKQLKNIAMNFISGHAKEFFSDPSWKEMLIQHPGLAAEIPKMVVSSTPVAEPPAKKRRIN